MLQKILEKVFITKKFNQFKTSPTLKTDVFEILDNKNIEKLFSKYELLFLDQANSSSDRSQILIQQLPIPRASLTPSPSLSNFTLANWNPSLTPSSSCSSSVSATTSIGHTKPYTKPSQLDLLSSYMQISRPSKHLVKHATHQRTEYIYSILLYFSQFLPPYSTLVHKIILTIRNNTPFHYNYNYN